MATLKRCGQCGELVAMRGHQKFCALCMERVCPQCGETFRLRQVGPNVARGHGPKKFCSNACRGAAMKGKDPHNKGTAAIPAQTCKACGTDFTASYKRQPFCSRACSGKAHRRGPVSSWRTRRRSRAGRRSAASLTATHRHHVVPLHAGGDDDPGNLRWLSVEEHACAHRQLWLERRDPLDLIAFRMLAGQIMQTEAAEQAKLEGCRRGGRNCKGIPKPPRSDAWRNKQREAHLGRDNLSADGRARLSALHRGNNYSLGREPWNKGKTGVYSEAMLAQIREARAKQPSPFRGRTHSEEANEMNRQAHLGRTPWSKGKTFPYKPRPRRVA